jgi:hypothetical protein
VDDGWAGLTRAADGSMTSNNATFPQGMKFLADHAHSKGLKFGLYSSNSLHDCGDQAPGGQGFERQDADTYASWGVDLLKYDNCGDQLVSGPPEVGYTVMSDALNRTGRPIFFAACEWAVDFPATWMGPVANTWRTTYDIQNEWECVVSHVDWTNIFADFAGPGAFNDMDILEVGNPPHHCPLGRGTKKKLQNQNRHQQRVGMGDEDPPCEAPGMNYTEWTTHFSLWAAMKSPLMIGCDLREALCQSALPIFKNTEVLAVSQDPLGVQARRVSSDGRLAISKTGTCRSEELPQNTVIKPCDAGDPLQQWALHDNGTIYMGATGECLQLDSGQGGCCSQAWTVWTNNAASALCNDPASCCGSRQQLWTVDVKSHRVTNQATGQCLTVHAGGMRNVGVRPCSDEQATLQAWDWIPLQQQQQQQQPRGGAPQSGMFVSAVLADDGGNAAAASAAAAAKKCLARTDDVLPGASEVWAGPLAGGDLVVLLFNRNHSAPVNVTAQWADLGLVAGKQMRARDLWLHQDLGTFAGNISLLADVHGVRMVRLTQA